MFTYVYHRFQVMIRISLAHVSKANVKNPYKYSCFIKIAPQKKSVSGDGGSTIGLPLVYHWSTSEPGVHGESHQIVAELGDLKHVESLSWQRISEGPKFVAHSGRCLFHTIVDKS